MGTLETTFPRVLAAVSSQIKDAKKSSFTEWTERWQETDTETSECSSLSHFLRSSESFLPKRMACSPASNPGKLSSYFTESNGHEKSTTFQRFLCHNLWVVSNVPSFQLSLQTWWLNSKLLAFFFFLVTPNKVICLIQIPQIIQLFLTFTPLQSKAMGRPQWGKWFQGVGGMSFKVSWWPCFTMWALGGSTEGQCLPQEQ